MIAIKVLEQAEKAVGVWPTQMPGHVNFGAEAIDVDGQLEDGAHRLDGSAWQFIVEGGRIVSAVREDMAAWWQADHMVYAAEEISEGEPGTATGAETGAATEQAAMRPATLLSPRRQAAQPPGSGPR